MVSTPRQALAKANSLSRGYGGMCLMFVRTCYGAPSRYASAIACWNAQSKYNVGETNLNRIPVGAPIFFAPHGSPYGHIAIYAGGGYMRTTNSATGRIATDLVSKWQSWGYRLLGYSKAIEGYPIPGLTATTKTSTSASASGDDDMATHIIFSHKGVGGIFHAASNTYTLYSNPKNFSDNIYALRVSGDKVITWAAARKSKSNEVDNLKALGIHAGDL